MIGIPPMGDATGVSQKDAVIKMVEDWKVKDKVIGLVFDTTASNTGIRNGCAVLIEKDINRSLLWLACRHHVYEVHMKNIWQDLSGKTVGPDEQLFKRFQSEWNNFSHDLNDLKVFEWPLDKNSNIWNQASEVISWGEQCIDRDTFPREDYRELLELTLVFLTGDLPGKRRFQFRKPGALHHARFMSKAIYFLKIFMLSERFELSEVEFSQVKKMANFIALFYTKTFLRSRIACFAPIDDFNFFKAMFWYKEECVDIANSALKSCSRHCWYLTEELVIIAIFNEDLSCFTRSLLARKLFNTPKPKSFIIGKPKFPVFVSELPLLSSLIGPRSWLLFSLMGLTNCQTDWLQLPPEYWGVLENYRSLKSFINRLEVVNDSAERGIKIISDYKDVCRNNDQLEYVIQTVEHHRQRVSSLDKNSLPNV